MNKMKILILTLLIFSKLFSEFGVGWYTPQDGIIIEYKTLKKISFGLNGMYDYQKQPKANYSFQKIYLRENVSEVQSYFVQINILYTSSIQSNKFI
jgi:hypothetical protein